MSEFLIPIAQIALSIALLLVAVLCLRLDAKLNALRKGNDGVAQTIVQLNEAVARADDAIKALRVLSEKADQSLEIKFSDARLAEQKLAFDTSMARALEPAPSRQPALQRPAPRERHWEDDDFVPARRTVSKDNRWDGLR